MAATPYRLFEALAQHVMNLSDVELLQLHLEQADAVCSPALAGHLHNRCYFVRQSSRKVIQIDLGGQVCADAIGSQIYSGFRGQVNFVTGARL